MAQHQSAHPASSGQKTMSKYVQINIHINLNLSNYLDDFISLNFFDMSSQERHFS